MKTKIFRFTGISLYCFGQEDAIDRLSVFFETQKKYGKIDMDALLLRLPEASVCAFFKEDLREKKKIVNEMNMILKRQGNLTDHKQFLAAYMICHPEDVEDMKKDFYDM